jgi:hypothetical protein
VHISTLLDPIFSPFANFTFSKLIPLISINKSIEQSPWETDSYSAGHDIVCPLRNRKFCKLHFFVCKMPATWRCAQLASAVSMDFIHVWVLLKLQRFGSRSCFRLQVNEGQQLNLLGPGPGLRLGRRNTHNASHHRHEPSNLDNLNLVHNLASCFLTTSFNITFPSTAGSPKWSFFFAVYD